MAQPTQKLPPWLSFSATTVTDAAGAPVLTSSSLEYLPLTYYGPSIPLGSLWTYGGLTSPAFQLSTSKTPPTATPPTITPTTLPTITPTTLPTITPTTSATPLSTTIPPSAIPTSTSAPSISTSASSMPTSISSTSSSNLSSSSTLTILSSAPISPTSPAASVTVTPPPVVPSSFANTHRAALVAIVLGAILGSVLLLLLVLLCLRWRVRRHRNQRASEFSFETPVWADWVDAGVPGPSRDSDQGRAPGEGSPRHSGSETDPFLTSSRGIESGGTDVQPMDSTTRLVTHTESDPPPQAPAATTPATAAIRRSGAGESDSSSTSGYGNLLDPPPGATRERMRGHIVPPADLLKMDDVLVEPPPGSYSPLLPPPRLDPDRLGGGRTTHSSQKTSQRSLASHLTDAEEAATLFTARRVRISSQAAPVENQVPSGGPSGLASSLGVGLGALAGLSRLSWFKNMDAQFPRRSRLSTSSYISRPLSDYEVETGKALLSEQQRQSMVQTDTGDRPISGISVASGNTVFHDAPSTPSRTPDLAPLPRALTPAGQPNQGRPVSVPNEPTSYEHEGHLLDVHSPTQTNLNLRFPPGMDILDIPAPPPASPFASSSSRGSMGNFPLPPGLALLQGFKTPSDGTSAGLRASVSDGITIDVLEEEPPSARDGWRSIAGASPLVVEGDRRTTFGIARLLHPNDPATSEQGSLHSMRSHHSPHSRSSGSAPISAAHVSGGSGSSRHSVMRSATGSSGDHSHGSLSHSGSISEDGRRRGRGVGATSPAMSAFGVGRAVNDHGYLTPYPSPPSSPLAAVHKETITSLTSSGTGTTGGSSTGPMMQYVGTPWATVMETDSNPK